MDKGVSVKQFTSNSISLSSPCSLKVLLLKIEASDLQYHFFQLYILEEKNFNEIFSKS